MRFIYAKLKQYKLRKILNANIRPENLTAPFGKYLDERAVEYSWLFSKISISEQSVVDVGSVLNFAYLLKNSKLKRKSLTITTLAPEKKSYPGPNISYLYEDFRSTTLPAETFDLTICLSTLEHVGLDNTQHYTQNTDFAENSTNSYTDFVLNLRKITKPGGTVLLSMPFGEYKNHGWLQVFNQEMVNEVLDMLQPVSYQINHFKYLECGWTKSTAEECKHAKYHDMWGTSSTDNGRYLAAEAVVLIEAIL